jgi:glycosyltransferase involved in cell wall biosynthesis
VDRRHLTPLLVTHGDGPLPRIAPDVDVVTRVVPIHDATALDLAATLAASPVGLLRRLGATHFGGWLCVRCDALGTLAASAREWRQLAQATLEARPDLVVSASPATHLPALVAGRLAGAPVLWHARDIAPARLQRLLDLFVGWTDGVLAPSQTAARAYHPRLVRRYGGRVRVLRPGIALPEPLVEDQRNELRRALGVPNAHPLLVAAGPLTPTSGHRALLDAITRLRGHYPDLHLVVAREGLCDSSAPLAQRGEGPEVRQPTLTEQVGERWLDEAIAAAGLDPHVTALGARTDVAALLSVADVAIFPAAGAAMSRPLLLALAQGTPIVAARAGALAEQLAEAWGFEFSEPEDAQSLAHAVESVVERLRRYRTDAKRNPGLVRDWGSARLEQARLLAVYREARMPAPRQWTLWPRESAANLPSRWLAALWAGVGTEEEPETEREDLSAVAASVPAGVHAWVSMGA